MRNRVISVSIALGLVATFVTLAYAKSDGKRPSCSGEGIPRFLKAPESKDEGAVAMVDVFAPWRAKEVR